MSDDKLIFIISQPRAGSTFLQRLLSNNELVNTTGEPWILLHCASLMKPELLDATFSNTLTQWAYDEYKKGFPTFDFQKIEKEYMLSLYQPLLEGYSYVVDKTPRYWEIINEIPKIFPSAKIIVLKRNPEAVLTSIIRTWQLESVKDLSRFQRDLLLAPFELQRFLQKNKDTANVLEVKYEALLTDLPTQTEAIYNWLKLPYNQSVLDVEQNNKTKGVFGDPYQNNDDSYNIVSSLSSKYQLSKRQKTFVKAYLNFLGKPFLNEYGYTFAENKKGGKSLAFEYFKTQPHADHHWKNETTHSIKIKFLGLFNRL